MAQTSRLRSILVATDLSSRADKAFDRAVLLAQANNARLTVLHVIADELNPEFAQALRTQARLALEKQVAQALSAGPLDVNIVVKGGLDEEKVLKQVAESAARGDFSVEIRIEAGSSYDLIIETAREAEADLVVCGSHRKLVIGDEWLGSTMDRVLRFGSRPVLIVKAQPAGAYQNIVAAVDLSEPSAKALEFAVSAFPDASFTLIHAVETSLPGFLKGTQLTQEELDRQRQEVSTFSKAVLSAAQASADLNVNIEVRQGPPVEVLRQHIAEHATDLVVVGTHGRTGLRRAILGSVAEKAISSLPCDVLAVHPTS